MMSSVPDEREYLTEAEQKSVRKDVEKERYRKAYNRQSAGYVKWWTLQFVKIALLPIGATAVLACVSFIHANWIAPGHERRTRIEAISNELRSRIEFVEEKLAQWNSSEADKSKVIKNLNNLFYKGDQDRSRPSMHGRTFFALTYELRNLTDDAKLDAIIDDLNIRRGTFAVSGETRADIQKKLDRVKETLKPSESDKWSVIVYSVLIAFITSVVSSISTWLVIRHRYLPYRPD